MKIIDGTIIANTLKEKIKIKLKDDKFKSIPNPHIVLIKVGDNKVEDYNDIKTACEEVGINFRIYEYKESVTTEHLKSIISRLSLSPVITGIMIDLPLPSHIDERALIDEIDPIKDIAGLTTTQAGMLQLGIQDKHRLEPYTAKGIVKLLESITDLNNKTVTVIGRNNSIGNPVAQLLLEKNSIVTSCNHKRLEEYTYYSDIVILALGMKDYIKSRYFYKPIERIVVDAGFNRQLDGKLSGDLDIKDISNLYNHDHFNYIPVNDVFQMSIAALLDNIYIAYNNQFDFIWKYCNSLQISEAELNNKKD